MIQRWGAVRPMSLLDMLAEQRIVEAMARGEFDRLEGAGLPLDLECDPLVPEDLRMAYRMLKNAGFVPPEVQALHEVNSLRTLIQNLDAGDERNKAMNKLRMLELRCALANRGHVSIHPEYVERVVDKLAQGIGRER